MAAAQEAMRASQRMREDMSLSRAQVPSPLGRPQAPAGAGRRDFLVALWCDGWCLLWSQWRNQLEAQHRATEFALRKRHHQEEQARIELEWQLRKVGQVEVCVGPRCLTDVLG